MNFLVIALGVSLLPVWRAAPDKRGLNLWQAMSYMSSPEHAALHIPYEQAVEEAREAYASCCPILARA